MPPVLASKREGGALDAPQLADFVTLRGADLSKTSLQLSASKSYTSDALTDLTGYDLPTEVRLTAKFLDWYPFRAGDEASSSSSSAATADGADDPTDRQQQRHRRRRRRRHPRHDDDDNRSRGGSGGRLSADDERAGAVQHHMPPVCSLSLSTILSDIGGGERRTKGTLRYKARIDSASRRWTYGIEADRLLALGDLQSTRAFVNATYMKRPTASDWQVDSLLGVEQAVQLGRLRLLGRVGVTPEGNVRSELRDFGLVSPPRRRRSSKARGERQRWHW